MLISIIIPVYNVEKYIGNCVDSILGQRFSDYEVILVDDGSEDESGKICDEYARKNDSIKVIHKNNGGLSDARNTGLLHAQGEYILFVDSDDYIGENSLAIIVECLKKQSTTIDVMFLEAYKFFPNGDILPLGDGYIGDCINGKTKKEVMLHLSNLPKFPGSACTKLIRRKLIMDENLYFEKELLSEDIDWTIGLLSKAETFAYSQTPYYYYRQNRQGSITNKTDIRTVQSLLYIIEKWASPNLKVINQREINPFLAYEYMIALYNYGKLTKKEQSNVKQTLKDFKWIMGYATTRKTKIVAVICKVLGIQMTAWMLKKAYKNK